LHTRVFVARFGTVFVLASIGLNLLQWSGMVIMTASACVQLATAVGLLLIRRELLPMYGWNLALYSPYYLTWLYLTQWVDPEFLAMWSGPSLSGLRLWGLPIEELAWLVTFGTSYPGLVAFAADARLSPPKGQ
jgi:hypothetical protein